MSSSLKIVLIAVGVAFFLFLGCGGIVLGGYNGAIGARNASDEAYGNLESAIQRRSDLIPQLVETVKGAAAFEKSTLESVIQARASATQIKLTADDLGDPEKMKQFTAAQGQLQSALSRLLVSVEKYPELKANQNFLELQAQLEGTENRINEMRLRYNKSVRSMNDTIQTFPSNIGAGFAHVNPRRAFEASESAHAVPQVKF